MTSKLTKTERAEAIARLQEWIKDGDTVYCVLRSRAASGMSRVIDLKIIGQDEYNGATQTRIWHIGYNAAKALDRSYDNKKEGIRISGCGMDMGFALVDDLRRTLGYKELRHEWL